MNDINEDEEGPPRRLECNHELRGVAGWRLRSEILALNTGPISIILGKRL